MRTCFLLALVALLGAGACTSEGQASPPEKRPELPATLMRSMLGPTRPCIERYRGSVADPYLAEVRLARGAGGTIELTFQQGDRADFNACVVEAVKSARVPADALVAPVVIPFAFSFRE